MCAAKGYPTPSYSWFIVGEDETVPIRGSDTLLLEVSVALVLVLGLVFVHTYISHSLP